MREDWDGGNVKRRQEERHEREETRGEEIDSPMGG